LRPESFCSVTRSLLIASAFLCTCVFVPRAFSASHESSNSAEAKVRSVSVPFTSETITIDGVLDEAIWSTAPKIGELIQREPDTGQVVSEKTEITLLRDADNLYVGVVAYDSEPDKVIGTTMARDPSLRSEDSVAFLLDTFRNQRNAFYFATNPAGALVDGLAFGNQDLNTNWDAIWDVHTRRTDQGWTAEFAIPFKSLSFPEGKETWGFNFFRGIYRKPEEAVWAGASLESTFLNVSEAGEIANMTGLNQGIGLDVRPFVASSWLHTKDEGDNFEFEPGLDIFYNITPSLKLTGTMNTDFAETEVDARQINLDRFSLFFSEKRSFFLEDVGVFEFASVGPEGSPGTPDAGADVFPFFSRRIGLLDGQEVPIDVGAKLTGKVGSTEIGFLGVQTGDTAFVEGKNFFVGRVKQNFWEQSYVGGIFTHGDPGQGQSNRTYGADITLSTSQFLGRPRNFYINAYGLKTENEGITEDDMSYGFSANYPNGIWEGTLVYREIQKNFDPGIGFVQRGNVRMYRVGAGYNPRPKNFLNLDDMRHGVYYTRFDRLDNGQLESSELDVTWLHWHFKSGEAIHSFMDYTATEERLFEPFEISPGVVLPVGHYKMDRHSIRIGSARKRPVSGSFYVTWGDFWSGSAQQISGSLTVKLPPWFTFETDISQTVAKLPEGNFTARVITSTINFSVSPRLTYSNLFQYDNRSRNLGWQSRVRWTLQPGQDLFLSFNQGWINDPDSNFRFIAKDTKIAAKFQYTFRF